MSAPAADQTVRSACAGSFPYEHPTMRSVTGDTLRPGGLALTDRALDLCRFAPGSALLDVGCGLGATVAHLAERGFVATGVEPSETLVERARRERPHVDVRAAVAESLPFPEACFDGAFMECSLSLIGDVPLALGELRRVLRPGALLVVTDVYRRGAQKTWQAEGRTCLRGVGSRAAFCDLLLRCGFVARVWEDHTNVLRELAARIVFAHGSLDAFFGLVGLRPAGDCACRPADLGYFLAIAERSPAGCLPDVSVARLDAQGRKVGDTR